MQGELVFCAVALHFVSDALHMTPACSGWSDYHAHIYVYSLLFWQDCVYSIALPIVVYIRQSAMDALVGSVIFIVRPDGVRISWSALNLDGCWAREAGFRFWKYLSWCILGRPKWTRPKYEPFWRARNGLQLRGTEAWGGRSWALVAQLQVPEAGTLLRACGAARGMGLLSPAKINEQGLPKAMFLKEVTLNQEAVHN